MRGMIFAIVFKVFMKYGYQHFIKIVPTLREFLLFPIIVIRGIFMFLFNFVNQQILGNEAEE